MLRFGSADTRCSPLVGIYSIAESTQRTLPAETNDVTHEVIHSSLYEQTEVVPAIKAILDGRSNIVAPLQQWEATAKTRWAQRLGTRLATPGPVEPDLATVANHTQGQPHDSLRDKVSEAFKGFPYNEHVEHVGDWLGKLVHESNVGAVVKELV